MREVRADLFVVVCNEYSEADTTMDHATTGAQLLHRAREGDDDAFGELVDRQRGTLMRHCYRMLGSGVEAEDAVQDAMLRAWRQLDSYDGRGSFNGWLYRIATNLCLDRLRREPARAHPITHGPPTRLGDPFDDPEVGIRWIEPAANDLLGIGEDPMASVIRRERVSLAFVAALHRLSPRERAALLLADVLDFSHEEVADVLDASASAVNSLLYRARRSVGTESVTRPANPDDPEVQALLSRYMQAWEVADIARFVETVSDDVHFSMPPLSTWFHGSADVAAFVDEAIFQPSDSGMVVRQGRANGQAAMATYEPDDTGNLVVTGLQVLDIDADFMAITAVTSFRDTDAAIRCGFPGSVESST